jgi:hypothetical protein
MSITMSDPAARRLDPPPRRSDRRHRMQERESPTDKRARHETTTERVPHGLASRLSASPSRCSDRQN